MALALKVQFLACRWHGAKPSLATHSVGGQTSNGRWRLSSSSSVAVCNTPRPSCLLQSNYSSTATLHGGSVVLRPVRATPCFDNR